MSVRTGIRISGFPVEVTETDDALTLESEGTRDLILDAGSGKVGVGTDDPAVALDVIGTGSFAGAASSLSQGNVQVGVDSGGDPGGELMFHTDDYVGLRCADSGAVSLAVKPSGNVGVGTTAPAVALDVIGTGSFAGAATSQSQGNVQVGVDSGGDPGGEVMFHTDDYVGLRCADSGALPFAVKPSGNVGIGDVAPGTQLQMSGTAPYVTLKNSTSENTAGGCESKLIFEDYGDNALGQIEVSHVGTSDDEKGQLILSTNADSGLQAAITINEEQMVRVSGDGGIEFKDEGDLIKIDSGALTVNSDSNLRLTTKETVGLNIAEAATDAVNYLEIENAAAASGPTCKSEGSADNIDLNISPKGTGQVTFKMPHVDGMVEVRGFESGTGVLGLTADEGDDNGDSWQLVATTDGHLNIKNDISGSQVNMIDIAANATAADSTIVLTGQLQVTGGKVEGPTDSDLTIQSDGNLTFMIDNDNDETDQGFLFKNNGSATIATLYDEGMLELSSAIMAKGTYKDLLQTSSATQAVDQSRDLVGCGTTTRAITITLPAVDEASGQVLTIFDQNANANNNNITIAPNAGDDAGTKIDNSTGDYVISAAKGAVTLTSDGTHWYVISKN